MVMVEETYLPLSLYVPGITDAQFQQFCEKYSNYSLEYSAEGELIIMPPTDRGTSSRNAMIIFQLMKWTLETGGGCVTDSSGGFILPNGSRLAPDASWMSDARDGQHSPVPEFVIELLSPSDRIKAAQRKMAEWIENGVELGWLIDPYSRTVTIYRPDQEPESRKDLTELEGEGPVEGFLLNLAPVWAI